MMALFPANFVVMVTVEQEMASICLFWRKYPVRQIPTLLPCREMHIILYL